MTTISPAPTNANLSQHNHEADIFDKHMEAHDKSKTLKTINLIYSLIVGILSSQLASKLPRHKLIGVLLALLSFN